jgi:hypothetical protein
VAVIDYLAIENLSTYAADNQGSGIAACIVASDNPAGTQPVSATLPWLLDRATSEPA